MKGPTFLALAWLRAHLGRTLLVVLCVALILLLPLAVATFVRDYSRELGARARSTPLVLGAPGSRFDLVLAALHFRGRLPQATTWAELETLASDPDVEAIPLHTGHTARGVPVVGTDPDYHRLRGLAAASGTLPLNLGETTLGAEAARTLGLTTGGTLLTDTGGILEFGLRQPLRLRVVGVLGRSGTPDDHAAFVDIKTAWILDGLGHGHAGPESADPSQVLGHDPERGTVLAPSVLEATEITRANAASFHFHGPLAERPLTAVLVLPRDEREATILKGRYRLSKTAQLLDPTEVTEELLGVVFRVKAFFDANVLLVSVATGLLLTLVVLLTLRVRRGEFQTLARLGAARATVVRVVLTEWVVMLGAGALLAWLLARTLLTVLLPDLLP